MMVKTAALAALAAFALAFPGNYDAKEAEADAEASTETQNPVFYVRFTVYLPTGNATFSGIYPYYGSAACSWNFPIGTQFYLPRSGETVTCLDRGLLGNVGWIDQYVPDWYTGAHLQNLHGSYTIAELVRWGWGSD
jgi:hypothetical protein